LGINVTPGVFNATMSLVESTFSLVAGSNILLNIIPYDAFGNLIPESSAEQAAAFKASLNAFYFKLT
jgi:hypothetical protein